MEAMVTNSTGMNGQVVFLDPNTQTKSKIVAGKIPIVLPSFVIRDKEIIYVGPC